jgi:hypothetical protein
MSSLIGAINMTASSAYKEVRMTRVDCEDKWERRERVSLPQAMAMMNWGPRDTIQKDSRGLRLEERNKPIPKFWRESKPLEQVNKVIPMHKIKRLLDVKL